MSAGEYYGGPPPYSQYGAPPPGQQQYGGYNGSQQGYPPQGQYGAPPQQGYYPPQVSTV